MNAADIRTTPPAETVTGFPQYSGFRAIAFWLREIAYQMAVANEFREKHKFDHLDTGDPR